MKYDKIEYNGGKENPIFVTMTSWKKRIHCVPAAIENLKKQTLKPDKVFLWLSSDELSIEDIPTELLNDDFVDIKWVDKNLVCFKRYLTIKQCPNSFCIIMDDDMLYFPTFIEELYNCAKEHNNQGIICYSCNKCNTKGEPWGGFTGKISNYKWVAGGATLYTPNSFPIEAFDYYYDIMHNYSLQCDECFLMPFIIYNNIPIYTVKDNWTTFFKNIKYIDDSQNNSLHDAFFETKGNFNTNKKNQQLKEVVSNLPQKYVVAFKIAFPDFEPIKKDIFKNNEILKKICEPAEGEFKQYFSEKERIIVTMTSWKKRIGNVTPVLKSILENTVLPDLIVVNLATEEFPNKEQDLPQELNDLIKEKNGLIEINWLKNNTKVWKKIFPTLFKYPNDCTINIDDDFLYPNDFVETFKNKHKEVPAKQLVGVDAKFWKGHNQHCGCASLDRLEWFGDAIFNINQNCLDNIGDDDFYTYCLYENKTETVFVGKKYFTNMKSFNSIEGFSRSAGLMSRTKINNVLNSLPSSSQTISSPKPVIQETKKEAINPLPKNVKLATNSLRILMNYH